MDRAEMRVEVEALLATLESVHKPNRGVLASLCRTWLAVADAPRVEASAAEVIALAGGNHWHAKIGLWGEAAKSLGGQTVLLVRADAAGSEAGE